MTTSVLSVLADNAVTSTTTTTISDQLSAMGVRPARENWQGLRIPSGNAELDQFLEGGLPQASLCEWGNPLGRGGREIALRYLASVTQGRLKDELGEERPYLGLWAHSRKTLKVNAPAWLARGVDLDLVRFATADKPLEALKPVFLEPLFKFIVLDGPESLTEDDCAFISRQARLNGQTVLVLRDHFLSQTQGNVWAKLRLNCWFDFPSQRYHLKIIRGLSPRQDSFAFGG